MKVKISLSHRADDFALLREDWQALQSRTSVRGVYQTWEWVTMWWEHFGSDHQLWLLQARDSEGRLVGLGALGVARFQPHLGSVGGRGWRQLEFLGSRENSEHLGFLVEPEHEVAIVQGFIKFLARHQWGWDVLCLSGLVHDSPVLAALESLDIPWRRGASVIAPYIELTDDWDEYFSRLGSDKRKAQRKRVRWLDRDFPGCWTFEQVTQDNELRHTLDRLVELHQATWEERGEPGAFGDPSRKAFLYDVAEKLFAAGWLRLYRVTIDGHIAAVLFSYEYRGRVYDLVSGVDWGYRKYNVGHVLTQYAIHNAVNNRVDEYDFLWGEEPYKYEWRAQNREHVTLIWFASPLARVQHLGFEAARRAKDHVVNLIRKRTKHRAQTAISATSIK